MKVVGGTNCRRGQKHTFFPSSCFDKYLDWNVCTQASGVHSPDRLVVSFDQFSFAPTIDFIHSEQARPFHPAWL